MADSKNTSSCAVICEYNPFHFGHFWQLSELKKTFGTVVCVLGGNLTQRGLPAIADRYLRAKAAVACGADLVVELPLPWCCSSASDFARGGVFIAESLGVDALAFSAESDGEALREAAARKREAEAGAQDVPRGNRVPYPKQMEDVAGIDLRNHPNDILAVEYLCHLTRAEAFILKRDPSFRSSTSIRASDNPLPLIPAPAADVLRSDPAFPRRADGADRFLLATLQNGFPERVYAVPDELRAAVMRALPEAGSVDELVDRVKGKMFTSARIRRALWASALGISPETVRKQPGYTLLLAANETGRSFLSTHKTDIPVVSRPAALKDVPAFQINLRANRVLKTVFGEQGPDDLERRPAFASGRTETEA